MVCTVVEGKCARTPLRTVARRSPPPYASGVLALAATTAWLAFTTRGSVRESYRARIDAFGQRVLIRSFTVD
jgi:hypothetical protein